MRTIRLNGQLILSTGGFMKPILVRLCIMTTLMADFLPNLAVVVTLSNGKEYTVKTPGKLYDVILKDKKLPRKETIHPTINSGKIGSTWGNKSNAND